MTPARLSHLLTRWEESFAQGRDLDPTELCPDEPQLHATLRVEIDQRRREKERTGLPAGQPTGGQATLTGEGPPDVAASFPRVRVPGYDIEGELGRGGMGVVYKARHLALNRPVALKMILHADHAGPEERLRFLTEAEAVAAIHHPGIVQVHDLGATPDGLPYLALELCPGGSLAGRLAESPLPPAEAAALVEKLARAVQAAHDKGILHRDLKPGNILFDEGGQPKITDFGLARRVQGRSDLTRTGAVVGTPSYMPPEQASGVTRQLGPAADIWSLGAILYECLTGRPPFQAATPVETVMDVLQREPPSVRALQPRAPRDLETIAHKCLQKPPGRRYPSAGALADDLRRFLEGQPITARPVGALERGVKWVRRRPALAGMLALVVVLTWAGVTGVWLAYREAVRERDAALAANQSRLNGLIDQLLTADPEALTGTLESLRLEREAVGPLLDRRWDQGASLPGRQRARLALALVERRPDEVVPALRDRLLEAEGPAEVLLLRRALAPRGEALADELWQVALDGKRPRPARFRALVALAELGPASSGWRHVAGLGAEELVQSNPLYLGGWTGGLRPVRAELEGPLLDVFRGQRLPARRQVAATVLSDYLADRPEVLVGLLFDADAEQLRALWPAVEAQRSRVRPLLRAELARAVEPGWPDEGTVAGSLPAKGVVAEVEAAQGLVEARFALCQALPLARAEAVDAALQRSGYRLERFRPYAAGAEVKVAALWHRHGRDTVLVQDLSAEQVPEIDRLIQNKGLRPVDVAGYSQRGRVRFAGVWQRVATRRTLAVGVPSANYFQEVAEPRRKAGLRPATLQVLYTGRGVPLFCATWERPPAGLKRRNFYWLFNYTEAAYESQLGYLDYQMVDVSTYPTPAPLNVVGVWEGERDRALAALKASPADLNQWYAFAQACYRLGHNGQALEAINKVLEKATWTQAFFARAALRGWFGDFAGAEADRRAFRQGSPTAHNVRALEGLLAGYRGEAGRALQWLKSAPEDTPAEREELALVCARVAARMMRAPVGAAAAAVGLGAAGSPLGPLAAARLAPGRPAGVDAFRDRAVALLEEALPRSDQPEMIAAQPHLASLRGHPGYEKLVAGLPLGRRYAGVRHAEIGRATTSLHGLTPQEQLARWRALAAKGHRPVALSVTVQADGSTVASSLWHRPTVDEAQRIEAERRRGVAAALLWRLGEGEAAWPLLRHTPRPDARSHLMARLAWAGVPAEELLRRLEGEPDASARRALIIALGDYGAEQLPGPLRERAAAGLLGWYARDPDPGVHAAIGWLFRYPRLSVAPVQHQFDWGLGDQLRRLDQDPRRRPWDAPAGTGPTWAVSPGGVTFTVIPGPVEFVMGGPPTEEWNDPATQHLRRIRRGFALAGECVTVAEWAAFRAANPGLRLSDTSTWRGDHVLGVSWFEAAQYCRWLSEREGVPEGQMCYPPLEEIERCKEGRLALVLPPDYLKRTGYRLPTEAEAEYVARAGAETAFPHGGDMTLLGRYAWHDDRVSFHTSQRHTFRPNDLGAFDLPGSPPFWCTSPTYAFLPARVGRAVADAEMYSVGPDTSLPGKGAMPFFPGAAFRASLRLTNPAGNSPLLGVRLARTWTK